MRLLVCTSILFLITAPSALAVEPGKIHEKSEINKPVWKSTLAYLDRVGISGKVLKKQGFRIEKVSRKSIAHQMGLDRGDLLLRINGFRIHSETDLSKAMMRTKQSLIVSVRDVKGRGVYRLKGELKKSNDASKQTADRNTLHQETEVTHSIKR